MEKQNKRDGIGKIKLERLNCREKTKDMKGIITLGDQKERERQGLKR